jgi:hypothetical protein
LLKFTGFLKPTQERHGESAQIVRRLKQRIHRETRRQTEKTTPRPAASERTCLFDQYLAFS